MFSFNSCIVKFCAMAGARGGVFCCRSLAVELLTLLFSKDSRLCVSSRLSH